MEIKGIKMEGYLVHKTVGEASQIHKGHLSQKQIISRPN